MSATSDEKAPRGRRSNGTPATGVAPEGLRAQGLRTRNAILEVARQLLLEGGSLEFSLRAVATRAGVSISNLQYYFPTRLAVVRALLQPTIDDYLETLKSALASGRPPRESLDQVMSKSLRDARDNENAPLFWHFVSLAQTDEECARLLGDWYLELTRILAQLIRSINPECKRADSLQIASMLIAVVDGLGMQAAIGRREGLRALDAKAMAMIDVLVLGRDATATTGG